jgi:putative sterol carrier protein
VTVYELTDAGWQLGPVVLTLARLGVAQLGSPSPEDDINADALVLLLRASFRGEHAGGDPGPTYQLELDGEPYAVTVGPGWVDTRRGAADNPTLTLRTSARTLAEILSGAEPAAAALADGRLAAEGPEPELDRFLAAFSYAANTTT